MSTFGSPGGRTTYSKPSPPERGSFPLDHEGECQVQMAQYLRCIKASRGTNTDDCRLLSRDYLRCRMERNLMAPDSMRNLGFASIEEGAAAAAAAASEGAVGQGEGGAGAGKQER